METTRESEDQFVPVADAAALDRLFADSAEKPVVLFKHDFACRISTAAHRELATLPVQVPLIDVERQKDLAAEVASRTGITHESPQVIVLRDGRAVYDASLWEITAEEIAEAAATITTGDR